MPLRRSPHRHTHETRHSAEAIIANLVAKTLDGTITWDYNRYCDYSTSYQGARIQVTHPDFFVWRVNLVDKASDQAINIEISRRLRRRLFQAVDEIHWRSRSEEAAQQRAAAQAATSSLAAQHAERLDALTR